MIFFFRVLYIALLFLFVGSSCLFAKNNISLRDHVIRENVTWSGTVTIGGVVVVSRKATLTIQAGTTICFQKIDKNRDGIGDSELRVLGQIIAIGTKEQPIIFKSAEKIPAPKDWSYLLIFTSSKKNIVRFCQFRDGFTGLQVHFSTTTVDNCLFEHNNEGLRFGRAKLTIAGSVFQNNIIGIRFTRMEGPVEIYNNVIRANNIGIFLVPSGQNIQDFFEPGRGGKAWNDGHLAISANNITANTEYNVKLGAKQVWDLKISNNWWGSQDISAIQKLIFDKHRDSELGKVIIEPIAKKQFPPSL